MLFRYLIAGGLATLTHFIVLISLVESFSTNPTFASFVGFIAAVMVNYPIQYYFVFYGVESHFIVFGKYLTVTIVTMMLNLSLFFLLFEVLMVWYILSQIISTIIIIIVNFFLNKLITFKNPS